MEPQSRQTEILQIDPEQPDESTIAHAAQVLKSGGLVAFPTETVYGLGANALDARAVEQIFVAKGRPSSNPLIVHVPDTESAQRLTTKWPEQAERLTAMFWPGPLTLVLPRHPDVPDRVTGGGPTVGVRSPAHPTALALLKAAGVPIAAPSANRSNRVSPTLPAHVVADLSGRIDLILAAGPTSGGLESTVLDLTTAIPTLLRPGLIAPDQIEAVIGPIRRPESTWVDSTEPFKSPGRMARHYAPQAILEIGDLQRTLLLARQGERVGWLTFRSEGLQASPPATFDATTLIIVPMPPAPREYAARLYAELHALDRIGVTRIVVEQPPDTDAWMAVRDRLQRAAAPLV